MIVNTGHLPKRLPSRNAREPAPTPAAPGRTPHPASSLAPHPKQVLLAFRPYAPPEL